MHGCGVPRRHGFSECVKIHSCVSPEVPADRLTDGTINPTIDGPGEGGEGNLVQTRGRRKAARSTRSEMIFK